MSMNRQQVMAVSGEQQLERHSYRLRQEDIYCNTEKQTDGKQNYQTYRDQHDKQLKTSEPLCGCSVTPR